MITFSCYDDFNAFLQIHIHTIIHTYSIYLLIQSQKCVCVYRVYVCV